MKAIKYFYFARKNKFDVIDFQNATLSGGVAVGAIADLMIQPGGAFIAGSLCGVVSTLGYRVIQVSPYFEIVLTFKPVYNQMKLISMYCLF